MEMMPYSGPRSQQPSLKSLHEDPLREAEYLLTFQAEMTTLEARQSRLYRCQFLHGDVTSQDTWGFLSP
ncbi:hypothetical protein ACOMHN_042491 [Nucella lapillus]